MRHFIIHSSPNIIKLGMGGACSMHSKDEKCYKFSVEKPEACMGQYQNGP
jgi:hypothetical protein